MNKISTDFTRNTTLLEAGTKAADLNNEEFESDSRNLGLLAGAPLGALLGAGAGGLGGSMIRSEDEEGNTHRMRNALLGALGGGVLGGAGGAYAGDAFGDLMHPTLGEENSSERRNWLENLLMDPPKNNPLVNVWDGLTKSPLNDFASPKNKDVQRQLGFADDPSWLDKLLGKSGSVKRAADGELAVSGDLIGAPAGALLGGGLGGIAGALTPSRDEEGNAHRLRNALLGLLIGGGAGAVGGGLLGDGLQLGGGAGVKMSRAKRAGLQELVSILGDKANPFVEQLLGRQLDPRQLGQGLIGAGAGGLAGGVSSFMFPDGADEDGPYVGRNSMLRRALLGALLGGAGGYMHKGASDGGLGQWVLDNQLALQGGAWGSLVGGLGGLRSAVEPGEFTATLQDEGKRNTALKRSLLGLLLGGAAGGLVGHAGDEFADAWSSENPPPMDKSRNPEGQMKLSSHCKQADLQSIMAALGEMQPKHREAILGAVLGGGAGLTSSLFTGHPIRNTLVGAGLGGALGYTGVGAGIIDQLKKMFSGQGSPQPPPISDGPAPIDYGPDNAPGPPPGSGFRPLRMSAPQNLLQPPDPPRNSMPVMLSPNAHSGLR